MLNKTNQTTIKVERMHCMHCAARVENAIKSLKGVKKVNVDLETGKVCISSKEPLNEATLSTIITDLGYRIG